MKKSLLLAYLLTCILYTLNAQVEPQPARTRLITYDISGEIVPIPDVRVRVETEVRTNEQGEAILKISKTADMTYVFKNVYKSGYTLITPNNDELFSRKFALNTNACVDIVLAETDGLLAERKRIERSLNGQYRAVIIQLQNQIRSKESALSIARSDESKKNAITQEIDSLRNKYKALNENYEKIEKSISVEAEKLAMIDYLSLDSIELKNIKLKKSGRADEVIIFNRQLLSDSVRISDTAAKAIKQKLKESIELRDFIATRYNDIAYGFKLKFENDSVAYYLKKRIELDPKNIEYTIDYAQFIVDYMASYDEALTIYTTSLANAKQQVGSNSREVALCYDKIGQLYALKGDYPLAKKYFTLSINTFEKLPNHRASEVAAALTNIGYVNIYTGEYDTVEEYGHKAIALFSKNEELIDHDVIVHGNARSLLAEIYMIQGRLREALELCKKYTSDRERILGEDAPLTTDGYNHMGAIYSAIGNHRQALEYYQKSMSVKKKILGDLHPKLPQTYNAIGNEYYYLGDSEKAKQQFDLAMYMQIEFYGSMHPDLAATFSGQAMIFSSQQNYPKALEYYKKALEILQKVSSEDSYLVATAYYNVGTVYQSIKNHDTAIEYYQKALHSQRNVTRGNRVTYQCVSSIGSCYLNSERLAEAVKYYDDGLKIAQAIFNPISQEVADRYVMLASVYVTLKSYDAALANYNKALHIYSSMGEDVALMEAVTLNGIGVLYHSVFEEYKKSLEYNQRAHDLYVKYSGATSTDAIEMLHSIGLNYKSLKLYKEAYKALYFARQSQWIHHRLKYPTSNVAKIKLSEVDKLAKAEYGVDEYCDYLVYKCYVVKEFFGGDENQAFFSACSELGEQIKKQIDNIPQLTLMRDISIKYWGTENILSAMCDNYIGYVYVGSGDNESALNSFSKAYEIIKPYENVFDVDVIDKDLISANILIYNLINDCYRSIGVIYSRLGKSEKSILFLEELLKIQIKLSKDKGIFNIPMNNEIVKCYNNLAVVYNNIEDKAKALDYYKKELYLIEQLNKVLDEPYSDQEVERIMKKINDLSE